MDSDDDESHVYNEFDYYLRVKRDKTVKDALVWWRNSHGLFPKTGMWYRDVGAVPASSAGVEREFSLAGDIVTKSAIVCLGKQFQILCSTSVGAHVVENILFKNLKRYLKSMMWRVNLRRGIRNSKNGLLNGWRRRNWGKQHVDYLAMKRSISYFDNYL